MNRRDLEKHLRKQGCQLHHHGKGHDVWLNPANGTLAPIPRHQTVKRGTVRGICRILGVSLPPEL